MSPRRSQKQKVNNVKKVKKANRKNLAVAMWAVLAGALLLLAGFIFYPKDSGDPSFTPEVEGAPSLMVDQEIIDFGNVKINESVTASFELTNVGDQTLRFTEQPYIELKAGC